MFGIKTRLVKSSRLSFSKLFAGRLTNDIAIRQLMDSFCVDEHGHRADLKSANLGYGFIHYAFIRLIKPKKILCIGSRYGYIPAILAQACKDNKTGKVYFVDAGFGPDDKNHWTGVGFWKTEKGRYIFSKFGLQKYIKLFVMTTAEYSKRFTGRKYDYIYIDGDHSLEGVSRDFGFFWPQLNTEGFISFHDICVSTKKPEGLYGVKKFWSGISKKDAISFKFEDSGLGILQKTK
jgi:predicted O-methyltransferase YrrM